MSDVLPDPMVQSILIEISRNNLAAPPQTKSDSIFNAALACVGRLVSPFPDLKYGHLACAFAVNRVVEFGTGQPIDNAINTASMFTDLLHGVGIQVDRPVPGSIVISPTQGQIHGHVGIVGSNGVVYSNSSSIETLGTFMQNYTLESWQKDISQARGLSMYYFNVL